MAVAVRINMSTSKTITYSLTLKAWINSCVMIFKRVEMMIISNLICHIMAKQITIIIITVSYHFIEQLLCPIFCEKNVPFFPLCIKSSQPAYEMGHILICHMRKQKTF